MHLIQKALSWETKTKKDNKHKAGMLLMEEILHHLIGSLSHYLQGFYTFQVEQEFSYQQHEIQKISILFSLYNPKIHSINLAKSCECWAAKSFPT